MIIFISFVIVQKKYKLNHKVKMQATHIEGKNYVYIRPDIPPSNKL